MAHPEVTGLGMIAHRYGTWAWFGVLRCGSEPDEELVAAEVADQGAVFASELAEGGLAGPRAVWVRDQ